MVGGIDLVHRRARLAEDTGIGLLFVGMLAAGVVVISREDTFAGDLTSFLFGDVLGVRDGDLVAAGRHRRRHRSSPASLLYRPFLALSFNRDKATALGLRPGLAHAAMLALLALAVVASFRAVGTLLVFGLLVAPPATATLLVRRLPAVMVARHRCSAASPSSRPGDQLPRRHRRRRDRRRRRRRPVLRRPRRREVVEACPPLATASRPS